MSDALMMISLLLMASLYAAAVWKDKTVRRRDAFFFTGGWLALLLALSPPVHELAEAHLWAHMAQHELIMIIAAPLLALGRPHLVLLRLLGRDQRAIVTRWFYRLRTNLLLAWALHGTTLWVWHVPSLYEAAVNQPLVHFAQHASFLVTALLFWWAALDRRSGYGAAALYTFATSLHSGILGALFFLAPQSWYRVYGIGHAALEDQQLAGLIMWIPGGVVFALTALGLLWRWLADIERRVNAREARALVLALILLSAAFFPSGCNDAKATAVNLTGGNPDRGKQSIRAYGCWTCHTIPGIPGANGVVGPPLDKIASRAYVAGQANSPEHLVNWLRHPQKFRSSTPMPELGVPESDARDIAAYLYTLR